MPQPFPHLTDSDPYNPHSDLPTTPDLRDLPDLSQNGSAARGSMVSSDELDSELQGSFQPAPGPALAALLPGTGSLVSLHAENPSPSPAPGLSASRASRPTVTPSGAIPGFSPLLPTVLSLDALIDAPAPDPTASGSATTVDDRALYQYSRFIGLYPRPPTPPITSLAGPASDRYSHPNYTIEVINYDGFILSMAAPARRGNEGVQSRRDALPLARQNAIRIKRHRVRDSLESTQSIAALHNDFRQLLRCIDRAPIYNNNGPFTSSLKDYRVDSTVYFPFSKPSDTMVRKLDLFVRDRRRSSDGTVRMLTSAPERARVASGTKRGASEPVPSGRKRRRLKPAPSDPVCGSPKSGSLRVSGLSIEDKFVPPMDELSILDGMFCSYVSDGASFHIPCVEDSPRELKMDLRLSRADYERRTVAGMLLFGEEASGTRALGHVEQFLAFLGGLQPQARREPQALFQKRLAAVCSVLHACRMANSDHTLLQIARAARFPVAGDIVDFKKNDLRFLHKTYPGTREPHNVFQGPNKDVEFELLQWLRIKPFVHFAEAKFYETIVNVERYLKLSLQHPQERQRGNLRFAQGFRNLVHELSRTYDYITDTKIPFVADDDSRRGIKLRKSFFVSSWDAKQAEEFCDHLVAENKNLTNVQLNYVLFTLQLDVSQILRRLFWALAAHLRESDRELFRKQCAAMGGPDGPACAQKVVFVCSVNRKNGLLHVHNTRPMFDYKMMDFLDQMRFQDYRDPVFRLHAAMMISQDPSRRIYLEDPETVKVQTNLRGFWRREAGAATASNTYGICGNYSVA